jgi:hypothetical protein
MGFAPVLPSGVESLGGETGFAARQEEIAAFRDTPMSFVIELRFLFVNHELV